MKLYFSSKFNEEIKKVERVDRRTLTYCINHFQNFDKEKEVLPKDILLSENGKPYIHNNHIFFSISHSSNLWLCAVDYCPIGLDIEVHKNKREEKILKLAERYFHRDEALLVEKYGTDIFYKIWSLKEALVKIKGKKLFKELGNKIVVSNYLDKNGFLNYSNYNYFFKDIKIDRLNMKDEYTIIVTSTSEIKNIELVEIK